MKITTTKRLFCLETVLLFDMLKFEFLNVETTDANKPNTLICNVNADFEKIKDLLPEWFNFDSLKGQAAVVEIEQEEGFIHNGVFPVNLYSQHMKSSLFRGLSNVEHLFSTVFQEQGINKQNFSNFIVQYLYEIERIKLKSINESTTSIETF